MKSKFYKMMTFAMICVLFITSNHTFFVYAVDASTGIQQDLDMDDEDDELCIENNDKDVVKEDTVTVENSSFDEDNTVKEISEKWYEDYTYTLDDENMTITLTGYIGSDTEIFVPAKAVIDGKEYSVIEAIKPLVKPVGQYLYYHDWGNVKSIIFEEGVMVPVDCNALFAGCRELLKIDLSKLDTSNVISMSSMFSDCSKLQSIDLSGFKTENVHYMYQMFDGCSSIKQLDLSGFITNNVYSMFAMFRDCKSLESIDISSFNTEKVTDMQDMFMWCQQLKSIDVSSFNIEQVESTYNMFTHCETIETLDVNNFTGTNLLQVNNMFGSCTNLKSVRVGKLITNNVIVMSDLFNDCTSLESIDFYEIDTSNVEKMDRMFDGCSSLKKLDLSKFDMSDVLDAKNMLYGCNSLSYLYTPINLSPNLVINLPYTEGMFDKNGVKYTTLPNGDASKTSIVLKSIGPDQFSVTQADGIYGMELARPVYEKPEEDGVESISYSGKILKDGSEYGPSEKAPDIPGSYIISISYKTDKMTYTGKTGFDIVPKELSVVINIEDRVYEKDNKAVSINSAKLEGVVRNDDVTADISDATAIMENDKAGNEKPVVVSGIVLAGSSSFNYVLKEQPKDIKVNISKAEFDITDKYTRGEAGVEGRFDLERYISEGASFGSITVVNGSDQLDGDPYISGMTLLWRIKEKARNINVTFNIPVTGAVNYNDYSITIIILGESNTHEDESITINGKKVNSLKEAFAQMNDPNTEYVLNIGVDVKGEKNLTIPKTAKAVYINGYGHTIEIIGTILTANALLTLENVNIKAVNKKGAPAKFTLLAKKDLNIGGNVSFDSSAATIKGNSKTVLSGILNARTVTVKDLTMENGAVLKVAANGKITIKGLLKGLGGKIELGKDFNKPINISGTVEGTIYLTGAKQSDGTQILKYSSKKISDASLKKCFDVKGITENTVDTYLYYYSSGKAAVFGESISYNGIKYGIWKDAVAAMNTDLKNAKKTGRSISFSVELSGNVNTKGNFKFPSKGYENIKIEGNGHTITFTGDIKLTGNTVISDTMLNKVDKYGNRKSGKVKTGKYTYDGPVTY